MALLINKDGKQLGPFSLDEARAQVLSGKLEADDWAWPDGATQWIQLKDVPGFAGKSSAPGGPPTPVAATEEAELWRGHPSQILNLTTYLFWIMVLVVALTGVVLFAPGNSWGLILLGVLSVAALLQCGVAYVHLHATEYVVSTQRVRIVSGILSKEIQEIELFRVKDTAVRQSFFLRMFGLGTITILSGDEGHPRLVLSGVPGAVELRERLRQEVMSLRQRFGVRELDVM